MLRVTLINIIQLTQPVRAPVHSDSQRGRLREPFCELSTIYRAFYLSVHEQIYVKAATLALVPSNVNFRFQKHRRGFVRAFTFCHRLRLRINTKLCSRHWVRPRCFSLEESSSITPCFSAASVNFVWKWSVTFPGGNLRFVTLANNFHFFLRQNGTVKVIDTVNL